MTELTVAFQNFANAPQNNTKANVVPGTLFIPWHHRQCLGILQWTQLRPVLTCTLFFTALKDEFYVIHI